MFQFKYIDHQIPCQPEVPFLNDHSENLKWLSQEFVELWIDKSNNKKRICINLSIEPKCQGDLQGHMIFYMTSKSYGPPRSLWPNCDAIWPKIREISAVESLMTSCMRDREWRRKAFYEIKVIVILLLPK